MNAEKLAEILIEEATKNGGATINRLGCPKTTGLSVAVDKKFEVQATNLFKPAVEFWIKRVWPTIAQNPYYCLGAWYDPADEVFYLDVVDVLPDVQLTTVIKQAKDREQKAIYHLTTETVLRIE